MSARIFFTSDHHFGHGGARGLFRRPFASTAEMDAVMIARWREVVREEDEVWYLGDFAVRRTPARIAELLAALPGRKHLLKGNNDAPATIEAAGWSSVAAYAEIVVEQRLLVLCHYPFRSWNGMGKGAINLHGHSHGRLQRVTRQIDVGVDVFDFRPVGLRELLAHSSHPRRR